ncbi:carboxymuconolactone decarboxylase family protein [Microbacterium sp. NPDC076911]|uniref:carboxymuconolactone decarboxylase family protein n=1 Tax=Microbacterium sp. NPDC076911 TaxID=3154958 RepID=UPI003433E977
MSEESRVHLSRSAPKAYQSLAAFSKTVGALASDAAIDVRLKELVQIHTSQINGCAYCVRVHVNGASRAGVSADEIAQIPVWRESGVFSARERAGFELAEAFAHIDRGGVPDDVYNRVGSVLTEEEYVALSWILVAINAFNRVAIAGRYPVPPLEVAAESATASESE